jgi:hypothetical protein
MPSKRKSSKKRDPNQLDPNREPGEKQAAAIARTVLRPTVQASITLKEYGKAYGQLDLQSLVDSLTCQVSEINRGDMSRAEAMLTAQAHTLDAIFNNLACRAALNMGEYIDACDKYLKLALRAQSQCRSTLETLATVKNPPVMGYVRQANIAHGPQQVNNAPATTDGCPPPGEKSESAKQTIGGEGWRTAGPRNGVHGRPS